MYMYMCVCVCVMYLRCTCYMCMRCMSCTASQASKKVYRKPTTRRQNTFKNAAKLTNIFKLTAI